MLNSHGQAKLFPFYFGDKMIEQCNSCRNENVPGACRICHVDESGRTRSGYTPKSTENEMAKRRSCLTCVEAGAERYGTCKRPSLGGYLNNWIGKTTENNIKEDCIICENFGTAKCNRCFEAPKLTENNMEDSGKRQQFDTGAVRDTADGKSRPDLISPYAQLRKGQWLRLGAEKYAERNWEKGMKISRCIASICRHLFQYMTGSTNEDHLAAIAVNAEFIMHYEAMIKKGLLPSDLDDMPKYEQQEIEINHPRLSGYCPTCREAILTAKDGEAVEVCGRCVKNAV